MGGGGGVLTACAIILQDMENPITYKSELKKAAGHQSFSMYIAYSMIMVIKHKIQFTQQGNSKIAVVLNNTPDNNLGMHSRNFMHTSRISHGNAYSIISQFYERKCNS